MKAVDAGQTALNGICPYFTMFPLNFPLGILKKRARKGDTVLDPFCGRGTTNFAARLTGLNSLGVDSSPVAAAITASKLVNVTADAILDEAKIILHQGRAASVPSNEFWKWAFAPNVLKSLCIFREAFLNDCATPASIALRGIILGALHGPKQKTFQSYFSNQCPRTYAPKPAYATRFWRERKLVPEPVDVMDIITRRAKRYYCLNNKTTGTVRLADSRISGTFVSETSSARFNWVITSPPYYGMQTYIPDQWLRNWFLGGSDIVDYNSNSQLVHSNPDSFTADLHKVWRNVEKVCRKNANMVIRFGGLSDRHANPDEIIKKSLLDSGWHITTIKNAGSATKGYRQADTFLRVKSVPLTEYDIWARK